MRGEHAEVVMPMPARRRDQRGESVEQFERGEGELGRAAGQGLGQSVADRLVVTLPGEPRAGEGRSGAVAQQSFEAGAILGLEAHGGVQREPAAVVPAGKLRGNLRGERTVADGDPQRPAADASLHGAERGRGEIGGGMEAQRESRGASGQRRRSPDSMVRNTLRRTRPSSTGSRCRKNLSRRGKVTTHWRTGTCGNTCSTRCAAVSAMRRVAHDGHRPRPVAQAGLTLTPDPMPDEVVFVRSDQYAFVRAGVPAIYLLGGVQTSDGVDGLARLREFLGQRYHLPSDDLSQPSSWVGAARLARVNVGIGLAIGNDPARPEWKPGDFFGEKFGR
jgi:hypothetical protein